MPDFSCSKNLSDLCSLISEENKKKKEAKKKKENSQSKEQEKAKKKKENFRSNIGRERNMQKGLWTRQCLNNTELSPSKQEKKENHDLK